MTRIIFEMPSGDQKICESEPGKSVMQVGVSNLVDGIIGDCGGYATCATCHVYVDDQWVDTLPPAQQEEVDMLEVADDPLPNSRLACQIQVESTLDGLVVHVPPSSL